MAGIARRVAGDSICTLRGKSLGGDASKLMLVHITAVGSAREILRAGQIEMRNCTVFKRGLTYFFVMRPAYKLKESGEKHKLLDFFPFVFVIDPKDAGPPFHVYPFDTGGAVHGAFEAESNPYVFLEDFELDANLSAAASHIDWAFGTLAAYYDGELKPDLYRTVPQFDSTSQTFINIAMMARYGSNQPDLPDQRASAIEVAYNNHVRLKPHVKFAIIPKQFLEDPCGTNDEMIDALNKAGIDWDHYDWQPNKRPADFHKDIDKLVRKYYASKGLL